MTRHIGIYQSKHGQGCSSIAASLAIVMSRSAERTVIVDRHGDIPAILGMPTPDDGYYVQCTDTLWITDNSLLVPPDADVVIHDMSLADQLPDPHTRVLVTIGCYLALRRGSQDRRTFDMLVEHREVGRALSGRDLENALGLKIITVVDHDPAFARLVDAGLLASRLPHQTTIAMQLLARRILDGATRVSTSPTQLAASNFEVTT